MNQPIDEVKSCIQECGLDLAQLHGEESGDYCKQIMSLVPVFKVVHVPTPAPGESVKAVEKQLQLSNIIDKQYFDTGAVAGLLLDTKIKGQKGGTGVAFDWDVAKAVREAGIPCIVAGGLTADNVAQAVSHVIPWGVDVSSGVEDKELGAGRKDHEQVKQFVDSAKTAVLQQHKL